jgi:transcription elongation factor Elf1
MAYENLKKFKCGNCGNDKYLLFTNDKKNIQQIITECIECKCQSEINIVQKIEIDWGQGNNDGIMCIYD